MSIPIDDRGLLEVIENFTSYLTTLEPTTLSSEDRRALSALKIELEEVLVTHDGSIDRALR